MMDRMERERRQRQTFLAGGAASVALHAALFGFAWLAGAGAGAPDAARELAAELDEAAATREAPAMQVLNLRIAEAAPAPATASARDAGRSGRPAAMATLAVAVEETVSHLSATVSPSVALAPARAVASVAKARAREAARLASGAGWHPAEDGDRGEKERRRRGFALLVGLNSGGACGVPARRGPVVR